MGAIKPLAPKFKNLDESSRFLSKSFKFILVIVAFLVYFLSVPFFIILVSPLYLYRFLVILLAKCFRSDLIEIVSTRDGVVGLDDVTQKCECMLNLLLVYEGQPDINIIREKFQEKVMDIKSPNGIYRYAKFKYYYESWLGYAFWKQAENFKLEDHIRFCEDTENEGQNNNNTDYFTTEEKLVNFLGPLSTRTFAPKIPPWELLVIRNYIPTPANLHADYVPTEDYKIDIDNEGGVNNGKKWAVILRVHHAIADGFSLMKMVLNNLSDMPMSKIPQSPVRKMNFMSTLLMYVGIVLLSPYYHLRQFFLDVDRNLWHLRQSKLTRKWYTTMSEKVSLKKLKAIGMSHGVSTTAVLLSGYAGAIRKFLIESDQESKIPAVMRGLSPMPWKGHPMNGLVNHWTLGTMVFPVGLDCPLKRLKSAEKSVRMLKRSPILFTNFGTVPLLLGPPSWLSDIWATNWMTTFILSNFPGPNCKVKSFDNYWSHDVAFWLPQMRGSASMGIGFMSYNGGIRMTMTIDKAIIPEEASSIRLNELLNEEIQNLHGLVSCSETVV